MRLPSAIVIVAAALAVPALARDPPKIEVIMHEPCTHDLQSHRRCMTPSRGRRNYVVQCMNLRWRVLEKCEFEKPCIDPPSGEAYCANDFDPAIDKCPEGEVCAINDQWTVEVEDTDMR